MGKQPKAKADDQKPECKRYAAPKHSSEVFLPSGVKKIRRGRVEIPADALAEHELLIRAGFELLSDDAAVPESEPDGSENDADSDAPAEPAAE